MTQVIQNIAAWKKISRQDSCGLVPTMGALHEGHLSLIRKSQEQNKETTVSIFVNPTQFNNTDDYENYPITQKEDIEKLQALKVDYIFMPVYEDLYPDNYRYKITENSETQKLCGVSRPGHFDGVLSVIMKLLQIVKPHRAYFGKKDYQQYILIKNMVEAFFMEVEIVGCETVRESDGLAMSSRNMLLSPEDRQKAPAIYQIISNAKDLSEAKKFLLEKGFTIDYLEEHWQRRFVSVFLGKVRLIDNVSIGDSQ